MAEEVREASASDQHHDEANPVDPYPQQPEMRQRFLELVVQEPSVPSTMPAMKRALLEQVVQEHVANESDPLTVVSASVLSGE